MLISEAFDNYREIEVISRGLSPKTLESNIYAEKLVTEDFSDTEVRKGWSNIDVDDIKIPKREKRVVNYLTESEIERFIEVVSAKYRGYSKINRLRNTAIVNLFYDSGIRVSELCLLNRNSIRERQFTVIGKSKNPRICFITRKTEEAIAEYLAERDDNKKALFIATQNEKRITPDTIRKIFQNACKRSDFVNVHPHTIRHSFATRLLDKEVDIRYIAELMGHESLDTTKMYTHFSNPKLKKIYEKALANF